MALPLVGSFSNVGSLAKEAIRDAAYTTAPGLTAAVDFAQGKIEEKTEKTKRKVEASRDISPSIIKNARRTARSIVQPGINFLNPLDIVHNFWYFLVDILPGEHSSKKILEANLEILRDPYQTKDFQSEAMRVFRDQENLLDIDMKRMESKSPLSRLFSGVFKKANAAEDKQRVEKTKYLPEVIQSLSEHVDFIKENMLQNTKSRPRIKDHEDRYLARLTKRDFDYLKDFSAKLKYGKYKQLLAYPPMQKIKASVDEMIEQLKPAYDGFSR